MKKKTEVKKVTIKKSVGGKKLASETTVVKTKTEKTHKIFETQKPLDVDFLLFVQRMRELLITDRCLWITIAACSETHSVVESIPNLPLDQEDSLNIFRRAGEKIGKEIKDVYGFMVAVDVNVDITQIPINNKIDFTGAGLVKSMAKHDAILAVVIDMVGNTKSYMQGYVKDANKNIRLVHNNLFEEVNKIGWRKREKLTGYGLQLLDELWRSYKLSLII